LYLYGYMMSRTTKLVCLLFCTTSLFAHSPILASSAQVFSQGADGNPGNYQFTKNHEFVLGGYVTNVIIPFTGCVNNSAQFTATSDTTVAAGHMRFVKRINEKFLIGLDVFEPALSASGFPLNSPAALV